MISERGFDDSEITLFQFNHEFNFGHILVIEMYIEKMEEASNVTL
jgi:hypothetical protein